MYFLTRAVSAFDLSYCYMWQNHLNYPGSSALAITIKATPTQTHFKQINSCLSGNVSIQPPVLGSNKHTPHEDESRDITTTYFITQAHLLLQTSSKHYYRTKLSKTVIQAITLSSEFEKQWKENTTATHVAKVYQASPSKVSLIRVIAGRRRIPLYGPARR